MPPAPSISALLAACPATVAAPDFPSYRGAILMFGWHRLMRKEKGHNAQTYPFPSQEKGRITRVCAATWQHSQHCLLPDTHRERRRKAMCWDNEAASLSVFILSWINTPKGNTALCFVWKRAWVWGGSFVVVMSSFFQHNLFFFPLSLVVSAFQCFPPRLHMLRVCSLASSGRWSAVGVQILPARRNTTLRSPSTFTDESRATSCGSCRRHSLLELYHLTENM